MKTKNEICAIPTFYGGVQFKSRMEAQCALLFNKLGWKWEYEKFSLMMPSGTTFIPDFWLYDQWILCECRGYRSDRGDSQMIEMAELLACTQFSDKQKHPEIALPDGDGEFYNFLTIGPDLVSMHTRSNMYKKATSFNPIFLKCEHGFWSIEDSCHDHCPQCQWPYTPMAAAVLTVSEGKLYANGIPLEHWDA